MSDIEKLRKLTSHALAFKNAATGYVEAKPALKSQMINAIKIEDLDKVMEMTELLSARGFSGSFNCASKEVLLAYIKAADFTYEASARVLDKDLLATFIPKELKTPSSVEELEKASGSYLAAACQSCIQRFESP